MEKITKSYEAKLEVDEGKREVLAIISTDSIDRDNEVVLPKGLRRKNYAGNPVVLVNHNYQSLPIGKALWVKGDGDKVLAKYRVSDKTQEARDVFGLLQDRVLGAHSIGFRSLRRSAPTAAEKAARPDWENASTVHREWDLMEFSVVAVPCNQDALTLAVSKGCSAETVRFLQGEEGGPNGISELKREDRSGFGDMSPDAIRRAAERVKSIHVGRLIAAALDKSVK